MRRALLAVVGLVLVLGGALGALKLETARKRAADFAVVDKHRPAATKQLERVKRLAEAVKVQPPLDADTVTLPLSGVSFVDLANGPFPTGAFVDAPALEDGLRTDFYRSDITFDESPFWGRCIAWLETGKNPDGSPPQFANVIEDELTAFETEKYVGVVRTVEYVKPALTGEGRFAAGRYRFDVFFYELSDRPRLLGGLRLDANNDESVRVKYQEKSRAFDELDWLGRNLRLRAYEALHDALKKAAPSAALHPPKFYTPDP